MVPKDCKDLQPTIKEIDWMDQKGIYVSNCIKQCPILYVSGNSCLSSLRSPKCVTVKLLRLRRVSTRKVIRVWEMLLVSTERFVIFPTTMSIQYISMLLQCRFFTNIKINRV